MEYTVDSNIIIVRGANDILNSAYSSAISDGERAFPTVEHYSLFQVLFRAGFSSDANEILSTPNTTATWKTVRNKVTTRLGEAERAIRYVTELRDEFLLKGLRHRLRQDYSFRRALMDTGRALLAHCDAEDYQYGTGMEERTFLRWVESNGVKSDILLNWFRRYEHCPCKDALGNNKLGLMLMNVRSEELERIRRSPPPTSAPPLVPRGLPPPIPAPVRLNPPPPSLASVITFPPPPTTRVSPRPPAPPLPIAPPLDCFVPSHPPIDGSLGPKQHNQVEMEELIYQRYVLSGWEGDREWVVSDQILALEGPFVLLSQYYAMPFVAKKHRYRSVEHYAYQKLFKKLKLGRKAMEKIVTTPDPSKLSGLARRVLSEEWKNRGKISKEKDASGPSTSKDDPFEIRLSEFYERAMKFKFDQYPILKRLLIATGDSLLLETCPTTDPDAAFEWTICVEESNVQHFLSSSPYNTADLLRFLLKPEKKFRNYFTAGIIGRNRAGLALMRLRREYKSSNVEILHLPPAPPTGGELDENRLLCFTSASIFHPNYIAPFWTKEGELYQTVQHFICLEAAKRLGFPDWVRKKLSDCESTDVGPTLIWYIYERFPDPEQFLAWFWTGGRDEIFKIASRLKFEKHPDLLRVLLETGNSLLVYCEERYQSEDTEWSVGFTEQDLRQWMQEYRYDCRSLLKLCLSPLDARPAFLGGNRLGALLMELRREFRLRGFQPHTLPKFGLPVEVVLGTGGEYESNDDVENEFDTDVVWPNPHFLLCKKRGQPILDRANKKRRRYEQTGLPHASAAAVVAAMPFDQLKQTATMLLTKLSAMRKETECENGSLGALVDDLLKIRDKVPEMDQPIILDTNSQSKPLEKESRIVEPMVVDSVSTLSEQKRKWSSFEEGFVSFLHTSLSKKVKSEDAEPVMDDGEYLLHSKNWDEHRLRPLVELVWPHLTIRERKTALEWLWYTIKKLENMKKSQQSLKESKYDQSNSSSMRRMCGLVPNRKEQPKWVMPQINVVMTQKTNESNDTSGARAGTPQSEGTILDAVKYSVDWVIPETGMYPKMMGPL